MIYRKKRGLGDIRKSYKSLVSMVNGVKPRILWYKRGQTPVIIPRKK